MTRSSYPIRRFDGGINLRDQPYLLDDSQTPDCQNVYVDEFGSLSSRRGYSGAVQVQTGATITDMVTYYRDNNTDGIMVFCGGNTYVWVGSGAIQSIPSGMGVWSTSRRVSCAQYQDVLYMADGANTYKWNGSHFTRAGVSAPSGTASALGSAACGSVNGVVEYKYAYVNSASVVSNLSSATTLTASSQPVNVSGFQQPFASFGVNGYRIYRTSAAGSTYYQVASVAIGTASYTDDTADTALGTAAESDNFPPPSATVLVSHKDRLFYAGRLSTDTTNRDRVWYSEVGIPETVGSTNFFRFGWEGDDVILVAAQADQLIVGKEQSIWELHIEDPGNPDSWYPRKTPSRFGTDSPHLAAPFNNAFLTLNRFGFIVVNFQGIQQATIKLASEVARAHLASKLITLSDDLFTPSPAAAASLNLNPLTMVNTSGIQYNEAIWVAVTNRGGTVNNTLWYFDYDRAAGAAGSYAWFRMTNMAFADFTILDEDLYAASSGVDSWIYKIEIPQRYYDSPAGTAAPYSLTTKTIDAYWTSKQVFGPRGQEHVHKELRHVYGDSSAQTNTSLRLLYGADALTTLTVSAGISQDPLIDQYGNTTTTARSRRAWKVNCKEGQGGNAFQVRVDNYSPTGSSGVSGTAMKLYAIEFVFDTLARR